MMMFKSAIILISLFLTYVCNVGAQCPVSRDGMRVQCKSLYQCPSMLELVNKTDRSQQETELLKNSRCGFDGSTPKVCCTEPCYTPEGRPGECVNIVQCPHLMDMLRNVSDVNKNYIVNSICKGPKKRSVCCGDPQNPRPNDNCAATVTAFPPQGNSGCCGVDSSVGTKLAGGYLPTIDKFPWSVLIEYVKDGKVRIHCGGALISNRYVLTAAHCLTETITGQETPSYVRLGDYDAANEGPDCEQMVYGMDQHCNSEAVTIPIEQVIIHPQFNRMRGRNDIGLIRLASAAPYNDFIRPICLPTSDVTHSSPPLFTAGWGAGLEVNLYTNIKKAESLLYVDRGICRQYYNVPGRRFMLGAGHLCADAQPGLTSCSVDDGGPLIYANGSTFEVLGVSMFGPISCRRPIPRVFSNVFAYDSWIRSTIRA